MNRCITYDHNTVYNYLSENFSKHLKKHTHTHQLIKYYGKSCRDFGGLRDPSAILNHLESKMHVFSCMIIVSYFSFSLVRFEKSLLVLTLFFHLSFFLYHISFLLLLSSFSLSLSQFGDSQQLRLVRILRSTVMVRVGGGWMALDEFLVKNDPCRGKAYLHKRTLAHTRLHKHQEQLCIRKLMYLVGEDIFQTAEPP